MLSKKLILIVALLVFVQMETGDAWGKVGDWGRRIRVWKKSTRDADFETKILNELEDLVSE